jgi:hypothetical protein
LHPKDERRPVQGWMALTVTVFPSNGAAPSSFR